MLTERVREHLLKVQADTLPITSNLFQQLPQVSFHISGVNNQETLTNMTGQVMEFLARNGMAMGHDGVSVTFALSVSDMADKGGLEKASWSISASGADGKPLGQAVHESTLPTNARASAYEATLAAAMTSKLPQLRSWTTLQD